MFDKIYNWLAIPLRWLSKQIEWVKEIFCDDATGKASFRRIGSGIIILEFVRTYERVSWFNKKMEDVPELWLILILTALGYSIIDLWLKAKFPNQSAPQPPAQQ